MALQLTIGTSLVFDESSASFKMIASLLGALMPLASAILVKDLGRRHALWAALFVLAYPEFWVEQTLGVVDIGAAALVVLGTVWLWRALKQETWDWLCASGVAFGLALASLYQNAVVVGLAVFLAGVV